MAENAYKSLGDAVLMTEVAAGNHVAFEELLRRYETPLTTFCYGFTRCRESSEDLAQETFMRVLRNAHRYLPVAKFSTWLYKIAANLCINELKKRKLRPNVSLDDTPSNNPDGTRIIERLASTKTPAPLTEAERNEIQEVIRQAIDHLPDDQRTTLIMAEYHHMPYQEIAEILGVTVSAIKMRIKRARETLRQLLRILQEDYQQ